MDDEFTIDLETLGPDIVQRLKDRALKTQKTLQETFDEIMDIGLREFEQEAEARRLAAEKGQSGED